MIDKDKFDESLSFVARNYRQGKFSVARAWQRTGIGSRPWWQRGGSVAAVAAGVALVASACIYTWMSPDRNRVESAEPASVESQITASPSVTARIEFADESLANVVKEIERTYSVSVDNVPDDDLRVTLSFEGDAADLISVLNELFGINLELRQ